VNDSPLALLCTCDQVTQIIAGLETAFAEMHTYLSMLSYYGTNAGVLTLMPPRDSGAFTIVVKISGGETNTIVPCHQWGKKLYYRPAKGQLIIHYL